MRPDLHNPPHMTVSPFWADLCATLDAYDLLPVLDEQLSKPAIGHPKFAAARRRCRMVWLESELAILRWELEAAA